MNDPQTETQTADSSGVAFATATIVAAAISSSRMDVAAIGDFTTDIFARLSGSAPVAQQEVAPEKLTPAVPINKSIKNDAIICLEDGKPMKLLRPYLAKTHNMTPDQYRQRWNLPADYPMVAPAYTETRRQLAKQIGLGRKKGDTAAKRASAKAKKSEADA